ncbi:zinc finger and BTB domain-protein 48 [Diplogelasinospora grovesii]|uniref:Zinc finger and BTB domain-protein 48 n=1 Tax=Diplogelasinospora grovesii TaxID=303347 RepID=A0AAN6S0K5_9PEZI|nr:zinc finger and BTB domain-protein 48 [Diplogelasinospora grovesii]
MAIPIHAQSPYGARDFDRDPLPSISSHNDSFPRPFRPSSHSIPFGDRLSPSTASNPMAIRGADNSFVPPPLPPPRFVPIDGPVDPNLQLKEYRRRDDYGSVGSDSFGHSFRRPDVPFKHDFHDEGYQSIDSFRSPDFPSAFGAQTMKTFRPSGDSIDNSMLSKLNRNVRRSALSASFNDVPVTRANHTQLSTLSLPHRSKQSFLDSGFTKSPVLMSATSPRNTPFGHPGSASGAYRSPLGTETSDLERSPVQRTRRMNSGSVPDDVTISTQGSFDMRDEEVGFPDETSRMRSLNIEDQWRERERDRDRDRDRDRERERERERDYYQAGQKRRASSPLSDEIALASDLLRRRDGGVLSRGSPIPRLTVLPQGSVSSVSSAGRSTGSYLSNLSSMTSMGSFGRRSPNALSPGGLSPTDPMSCSSPYEPMSLTTSPRSSVSRSAAAQLPHQRAPSEHTMNGQDTRSLPSPRKLAEIPRNPGSYVAAKMLKMKGPYMCECCPKKPKKFETEEELKLHEAEKQYECSFCGNRFKNKNEAERHQNSLHVRRHSWSCSALTGYERAFHDSTTRPGEADTCGYCGEEFPRTGRNPNQVGGLISDQDWDERIRHLQDVHKFRECNSSKKFYRADHFRQHLKHSHAGTSGKWTNMLENACMIEEDPPVAR